MRKFDGHKNCISLRIVGVYMFILLVISTFFNVLSIWKIYKSKIVKSMNIFMITLLAFNLIATYIEAPYMIFNAYNCRYVRKKDLNLNLKINRNL